MPTGKITAAELAKKLGMSSSSVAGYQHGKIVTEERNSSDEKDLCLLVVTTIPVSVGKLWDFLKAERIHELQDTTLAEGLIDTKTFSLGALKFDHGAHSNITQFAMSKDESKKVSHSKDKEAAFREVLSARAKKYWTHGIKGIDAYEGKRHDLGDDLHNANKAALGVIHDPILREEIQAIPSKSKHADMHSLSWRLTHINETTAVALQHYIRYKKEGEGFVNITRQFYMACDFDAAQIVVGVVPSTDNHSAVFYVNHTFTAQVAGFGGGVKRNIGRKMMKEKLVHTMEKAQKELSKGV